MLIFEQITEAFRRYGVSANTSDLLLVSVDSPQLESSDVEEKMRQVVKGDLVSLSDLGNVTDWSTIKKVFARFFSTKFQYKPTFPLSTTN